MRLAVPVNAHAVSAANDAQPPSRRVRLAVALAAGLAAAALNWGTKVHLGLATDLQQLIVSAQALSSGADPYGVVGPGLAYDWPWRLLYPLPGVVVALPFSSASLSFGMGAMAFVFVGATAFVYALTREGWFRLPMLFSVPALWAFWWAQWSPILAAATVLPWLGFVYAAKPTIGAALFVYRPDRRALVGAVALVVLSFIFYPPWLTAWMSAVRGSDLRHFLIPIRWPGGALILLALFRWRRPEARLLVALACVPQSPTFYDMLPLAFIPSTARESVTLTVLTYIVMTVTALMAHGYKLTENLQVSGPLSVLLIYIPCLIMVLRRPNEGEAPGWLGRGIIRARANLVSECRPSE